MEKYYNEIGLLTGTWAGWPGGGGGGASIRPIWPWGTGVVDA